MRGEELEKFSALLGDVMAFYKQDVSQFAISVWWNACRPFSIEQVSKAFSAHVVDPSTGQYPPRPADIVRQLQGTHQDRSLLAWGKLFDAMQSVGAYRSVVFDDKIIHAVVNDMGGWPKVCRTDMSELGFVQKRFCDSYKAYSGRGESQELPQMLVGQHDVENARLGIEIQNPVLIGANEQSLKVAYEPREQDN